MEVRIYEMLKDKLIMVYKVPQDELNDNGDICQIAMQKTGVVKKEKESQVKFLERVKSALENPASLKKK